MVSKRIVISRTDSIGDSVLTLPLCGYLKTIYPEAELIYLGRSYTRPIVELSSGVDRFVEFNDDLSESDLVQLLEDLNAETIIHVFPKKEIAIAARKAGINRRIGTSGRLYHVYNCNKLIRFSRKRSDLHESQLNFKLLKGLNINYVPNLTEINTLYGLESVKTDIKNTRKVILHPGSRGSAVDWSLGNYAELANNLSSDHVVYITGTEQEGAEIRKAFEFNDRIVDLTGKMSLSQLIDFIADSKALVAASTGPLHIAAALGAHAIGLFVDIRPIHPGRWRPIGEHVTVLIPDVSDSLSSIQRINSAEVAKVVRLQL